MPREDSLGNASRNSGGNPICKFALKTSENNPNAESQNRLGMPGEDSLGYPYGTLGPSPICNFALKMVRTVKAGTGSACLKRTPLGILLGTVRAILFVNLH